MPIVHQRPPSYRCLQNKRWCHCCYLLLFHWFSNTKQQQQHRLFCKHRYHACYCVCFSQCCCINIIVVATVSHYCCHCCYCHYCCQCCYDDDSCYCCYCDYCSMIIVLLVPRVVIVYQLLRTPTKNIKN